LTSTLPRTLTFGVDPTRILGEVGLLFGSAAEAFAEVVQNAHRAGATTLDVHLDGLNVEFEDDGPGLEDPRFLFTVGLSGWPADAASDPAGMGAFALFALSEQVTVTSRPASGRAWTAEFGPEAFTGQPVPLSWFTSAGRTGLTIRARLKPTVQLPDLRRSTWRHRFPLAVRVHHEGETHVVPPVAPLRGAVIQTPLGAVTISRDLGRAVHRAVWEHRVVRFGAGERVLRHVPNTPAGAAVREFIRGATMEWVINTPSTPVRPKLPDRSDLIEDAALEAALEGIACSLAEQVGEDELLAGAERATRGESVIPVDSRSYETDRTVSALGTVLRLDALLPFLGYVRGDRAVPAQHLHVDVSIHDGEDTATWTEVNQPVWVRPAYRAETESVAMLALAQGIPAIVPPPGSHYERLPLLEIEPEVLVAATSIGQLFAEGLHFRSGGRRLDAVRNVYSWSMAGEGADLALSPRWRTPLQALEVGPDDGDRVRGSSWLGLHPLPAGVRALDYVRSSRAFAKQALLESTDRDWPVNLWEFASGRREDVDVGGFVRHLADLFASELGPVTASEVHRETHAVHLSARCRKIARELRRTLPPVTDAIHAHRLAPGLLQEIESAAQGLSALLDSVTPRRLLDSDPRPKA
jgi:hypothetical protein